MRKVKKIVGRGGEERGLIKKNENQETKGAQGRSSTEAGSPERGRTLKNAAIYGKKGGATGGKNGNCQARPSHEKGSYYSFFEVLRVMYVGRGHKHSGKDRKKSKSNGSNWISLETSYGGPRSRSSAVQKSVPVATDRRAWNRRH